MVKEQVANKQFHFWTNWLLIVNSITVFIGMLIAFFGNSFLFEYHNKGTGNLFFGGRNIPLEILTFKNWLFGIIGATISGFHLLMVFIVHFAFRKKQIWARNAIALAMVTWFALDSGLSLYYGAYYNIYLINIPSFVIIVLPLIVTWKEFSGNGASA
ncbi:hypothetical protein SAMN04488057_12426 [Cyclobacterium lianum]|uniref:Uncharacterized protein n=1 Tax=Cyclobacterium lianum TaxID=388280 RepID=A0A1M7QT36_9BACT|nr:hypothetical protein [Cyclobacterium lianum]SHN34984.1 hypothetical protein SAMN04488057_12426 [Cyclobacterium lianum]